MKRLVLGLAPLALAACEPASGFVGAPGMTVASDAEVAACTPTKVYTTTPGVYGPVVGEQALEFARNETMANAQEDGANTIVFDSGGLGDTEALFVRARGYIC
ncbi:MAG: hypothetical protein AAFQ79_15055 [Pseudomonadota bacterium]